MKHRVILPGIGLEQSFLTTLRRRDNEIGVDPSIKDCNHIP